MPVHSMALYKKAHAAAKRAALDDVTRLAGQHSSATAQSMCEQIVNHLPQPTHIGIERPCPGVDERLEPHALGRRQRANP